MSDREIKRCLECGSHAMRVLQQIGHEPHTHFAIVCDACDYGTPSFHSPEDVRKWYNTHYMKHKRDDTLKAFELLREGYWLKEKDCANPYIIRRNEYGQFLISTKNCPDCTRDATMADFLSHSWQLLNQPNETQGDNNG